MMNHITLSENQISTIVNGLRVAADRFDEHVKTVAQIAQTHNATAATSLARQFERQAAESRQLATFFEECEIVRCTTSSRTESVGGGR